jgi:molecular chaperone HtpG
VVSAYAASDASLRHLIDLALLANGMLKGEALSNFIARATKMMEA